MKADKLTVSYPSGCASVSVSKVYDNLVTNHTRLESNYFSAGLSAAINKPNGIIIDH